jgi:hypothetical protein
VLFRGGMCRSLGTPVGIREAAICPSHANVRTRTIAHRHHWGSSQSEDESPDNRFRRWRANGLVDRLFGIARTSPCEQSHCPWSLGYWAIWRKISSSNRTFPVRTDFPAVPMIRLLVRIQGMSHEACGGRGGARPPQGSATPSAIHCHSPCVNS